MQEDARRKLAPDDEQVSNPEAEDFFNSIVQRYRQTSGSPTTGTASGTRPPQGVGMPREIGAPPAVENAPMVEVAPSHSPAHFVVCSGCGSSMPAVNRLCYVCGTLRAEPEKSEIRMATPAPELKVNRACAEPPLPRPVFEPQPAPAPQAEPATSTATLFQTYRPNTAPDEEATEETRRNYRPLILGAVAVLLAIGAIVLAWSTRHSTANLLATFQHELDTELAHFWNGNSASTAVPVAPAPPQRAHSTRDSRHYSSSKRVIDPPPPPQSTALHVRVEGQPTASAPPVYSKFAAATSYSSPNVQVAMESPSPLVVRVSPRESLQLLMKQVSPSYPEAARAGRVQGSVVLKAIIGRDGRIGRLDVVSGDELLIPAALDAVKQWLYRPYLLDGQPQEVETMIVVDFSLADATAAARTSPAAALR